MNSPTNSLKLMGLAFGLSIIFAVSDEAFAAEASDTQQLQDVKQSKLLNSIDQRFAAATANETPNFQRHVIPLMGRLGCNGRACHGSFQGRGDFRLSLFGYDFKADHEAITQGKEYTRVDVDEPAESMIVYKPLDADVHEGGKRFEENSWQHHVIQKWVEGGAEFDHKNIDKLIKLEVTPKEILFAKKGEVTQLKAIAVWEDGTKEDVTPLCRFTTNNEEVAPINIDGEVKSGTPGDTHVVVAYDKAVVAIPVIQPTTDLTGDNYPKIATKTTVDQLVLEKLSKLGILPSEIAADEEFLRRVSLDIAGTLPTPAEINRFVADTSSDKRAKKIEELLETPAYVAKWTTLLCDITGNNDTQLNNISPVRTGPSQEWYDWVAKRVAENMPYDQIAEGFILAKSRTKDQSYQEYCEEMSDLYRKNQSFADRDYMTHYWARRDFRKPEDRAIAFAYAFMGVRIQCAQCHKHPFDVWSKDDFDEFKTFFSQATFVNNPRQNGKENAKEDFKEYQAIIKALKLDPKLRGNQQRREFANKLAKGSTVPFPELVINPVKPTTTFEKKKVDGKVKSNKIVTYPTAKLLGETEVDLHKHEDIRKPIMDWLRQKDNRYFARAFVNRVWASYFNVGIVEPADNLSLGNPPSNEALLDYLAKGFVESGYDMKWVHRTITNSDTYQRTWKPNDTNRNDFHNFSRAVPRRLTAEVAYDILSQATANDDIFNSYHDDIETRTVSIPGTRTNGKQGSAAYGLQIFGRSTRESNCDCDRSQDASLLQTVFLQNDNDVFSKIDGSKGWISQLARELKPESATKNSNSKLNSIKKQISTTEELMAKAQGRLKQLQKQDGQKAQITKLEQRMKYGEKRLVSLKRQLKSMKEEDQQESKPAVAQSKAPKDASSLIELAYLRTLSRKPSEEELSRSLDHFEEVGDPVEASKDLLWALINTKEFIVNH